MTLLLSLALLPAPAHARALPPAGDAALSSSVEVPLLRGPADGDERVYVEAKVGDTSLLLAVATGHSEVWLTSKAAGRAKLAVRGGNPDPDKTKDGKATIESLALGAATLTDVKVRVAMGPVSTKADGEIGLAGFPDLAWALRSSQGVLVLAPASEGAALVASVGGAAHPTPDFGKLATRSVKSGHQKDEVPEALPLVLPVTVDGIEVAASVCLECADTALVREFGGTVPWSRTDDIPFAWRAEPLPSAPTVGLGLAVREARSVTVAGATRLTAVARPGVGPVYGFVPHAELGAPLVGTLDLAVDPVGRTFALADKGAPKRGASRDLLLARAQKAVTDAKAAAEPDTDAVVGALAGLAEARTLAHDPTAALATWREVVGLRGDRCEHLVALGKAALAAGDPAVAADAFGRADTLYAPWAKLSLDERSRIRQDWEAAQAKDEAWTAIVPQAGTCFEAAGLLASAQLARGDAAAVGALYPARLDLDPGLPRAAGSAALLSGVPDAARAAFQQALTLARGAEDRRARAGLFLSWRDQDPARAAEQIDLLARGGSVDPLVLRLYAESLRDGGTSVAALSALATRDPLDPHLLVRLATEKRLAGAGDADAAFTAAEKRLSALLATNPDDGRLTASRAVLYAAFGRVDEARAILDRAMKVNSDVPWVWAAGEEIGADLLLSTTDARMNARVRGATDPAYATLKP